MTSAFFAQLDAAWLTTHLDNRPVESVDFDGVDLDKLNKTSGLRFGRVAFKDGGRASLVFKVSVANPLSALMGLAREAFFTASGRSCPRWTARTAPSAACCRGCTTPTAASRRVPRWW